MKKKLKKLKVRSKIDLKFHFFLNHNLFSEGPSETRNCIGMESQRPYYDYDEISEDIGVQENQTGIYYSFILFIYVRT